MERQLSEPVEPAHSGSKDAVVRVLPETVFISDEPREGEEAGSHEHSLFCSFFFAAERQAAQDEQEYEQRENGYIYSVEGLDDQRFRRTHDSSPLRNIKEIPNRI